MIESLLIQIIAHKALTQALWMIVGMTAPFWLLMIVSPRKRWMRSLASPHFGPAFLSLVLIYFFYLVLSVGPPKLPEGFDFSQSKAFIAHPLVLLLFVCNTQILHLFLGTIIFREANQRNMKVRFELLLTWVLGPIGWSFFVLRVKFFHR